jgi:hypothetical protein
MRKLMAFALATSLATAGSAYAASSPPAPMNDSELDGVTAGALINVFAVDVVDVNNNRVNIPIAAEVAAAILSPGSTATQFIAQPGRVR